jgi:hypothetical protein
MAIKFCPNCGVKLPETMGVDPDKLSLEDAAEAAKSGFDSGKPFLAKAKNNTQPGQKKKAGFGTFLGITLIIIFAAFLAIMFMKGGTVRNCIGSINGAPECSDCTTNSEPTTLNGKSVGNCTANPGTGDYADQCTLNCP